MKIHLLARSRLENDYTDKNYTDGEGILLTALRNCYSSLQASQILKSEKEKYFNSIDGKRDCQRLFTQIINKGHLSTLEHISFTFAIEDVSRSLLAQLTRHRVGFSYSVKSQRYIKLNKNGKSNGFKYLTPDCLKGQSLDKQYHEFMIKTQEFYDQMIESGVNAEDARMILPNATLTDIILSCNLRSLSDFYAKRANEHAQKEIHQLAEMLAQKVIEIEPWTEILFK